MFKRKSPALNSPTNTLTTNETFIEPQLGPAVLSDKPEPGRKTSGAAEREQAVIACASRFCGDIEAQCAVLIGGVVEGNITSTSEVRILQSGRVNGEINAPVIIIDGMLTGLCRGAVVEIHEHGQAEGIIQTNELSINKKGRFIGISEAYMENNASPSVESLKDKGTKKMGAQEKIITPA